MKGGYGYGDEYYEEEWRDDDAPRGRGKGTSAAYRDVIFLGLDDELTESDVSRHLDCPVLVLSGIRCTLLIILVLWLSDLRASSQYHISQDCARSSDGQVEEFRFCPIRFG